MAREPRKTFTVENAQIKYRNFSGRQGKFNSDRTFTIILDDERTASQMLTDGWNVKFPKTEDDDPDIKIDIKVKFDIMPPRIVAVTSTSRFDLDEDTVGLLDGMDISYVDLVCNSYYWENNGNSGLTAYLKKMVVVIEEDELDRKWGLNETMGNQEPVSETA